MPDFVDEVVAEASQEVLDACGSDTRCIYDALQTGDLEIGLDTMIINEVNTENEALTGKYWLLP